MEVSGNFDIVVRILRTNDYGLLTHIRHSTGHRDLEVYVKPFGNIDIAYDGLTIEAPH